MWTNSVLVIGRVSFLSDICASFFFFFLFLTLVMANPVILMNNNFTNDIASGVAVYRVPNKFNVNFCGLRVLQLNLRSIRFLNRFDLFKFYLSRFPHVFDILVLSETWIQPDMVGLYNIPGFKSVFSCRKGYGGGLAVYINEFLDFSVIQNLSSDIFYISIAVNLKGSVYDKFKLHAYYRPPYRSNQDRFL